ncbi:MAG: hypothetical protein RIC03_02700 [Cyclobacteriaceae bacterium]
METLADNWLQIILFAGLSCFAMAFFIQLKYYMELKKVERRTERYKLAAAEESRRLRKASYYFSVGVGLLFFYGASQWMGKDMSLYHYLFVSFFAVIIAYAVGYSCWVILKYYYPFILEKRLNSIRFKPMYSPTDGRPLTLLTENEEDAHLTRDMQEEENAFSSDYDVWLNEITGEKVIEKYETHYHRQVCEECNFRTLKDIKETVIVEPTDFNEGLLEKEYKCSYCGHKQTVQANIPSWMEERTMA